MPETSKTRSWKWLLVVVVSAGAVCFSVFCMVIVFGQVSGTELATDSFRMRDFQFFRLPWIHRQLTPAEIEHVPNKLVNHLETNKLLRTTTPRWDVVESFASGQLQQGDAKILRDYLTMSNSTNSSVWLGWTRERPEQARVFWPAVQQAADLGAYELLPGLFRFAENTPSEMSAGEFKQRTVNHLSEAFRTLAAVTAAAGDQRRAQQLTAAAEQPNPDNVDQSRSSEPDSSPAKSP